MSRGWESKDVESQQVESQQEEAAARRAAAKTTPPSVEKLQLDAERRSLELSRTRVVKDLEATTNFRRQEQLRAALKHLDEKLAALG
jgi:hypothetical protein